MGASAIEWTDETWNPVTGCSKVSAGCKFCYAERMSSRLISMGKTKYFGVVDEHGRFNGMVRCHDDALGLPLRWKKPRRVFVNSMGDLFHEAVPFEFIDKVFAVMALSEAHTFQVLTKRPERMAEYLNTSMAEGGRWDTRVYDGDFPWPDIDYERSLEEAITHEIGPLPNVWLGTSVENQEEADRRIPELLKCPAAVRFLSCEPLLAAVDLELIPTLDKPGTYNPLNGSWFPALKNASKENRQAKWGLPKIDWVIVGGESGPGARPMHPDWVRGIRDQCVAAHVPFFFKQWGDGRVNGEERMVKGKKGGRVLDDRTWDQMPGRVVALEEKPSASSQTGMSASLEEVEGG